jgi:hypothetical protein
MSSRVTHDIVVRNGTYTDPLTGECKPSWLKIGNLLERADGSLALKLFCMPLESWDGWASVLVHKTLGTPQGASGAPATAPFSGTTADQYGAKCWG